MDSSKAYLPNEKGIVIEFGGTAKNQHIDQIELFGIVSVLYDLLNNIALDSTLAQAKVYEVELLLKHPYEAAGFIWCVWRGRKCRLPRAIGDSYRY